MKGFKQSSKGFGFPTSADASFRTGAAITPRESSALKQIVRPHFRSKVGPHPAAFAKGGPVVKTIGDQGHATVQRSKPITEFDAKSGGKGPLRTGYAKGGKIPAGKMAARKGKSSC